MGSVPERKMGLHLHHLSYLQQVSDLLEDKHKPLAARLGFIAKKITLKHLVHVNGADPPKLRRCRVCQAPITSDNVKSKNKSLVVSCSLCGFRRKFSNSRPGRPAVADSKRGAPDLTSVPTSMELDKSLTRQPGNPQVTSKD